MRGDRLCYREDDVWAFGTNATDNRAITAKSKAVA